MLFPNASPSGALVLPVTSAWKILSLFLFTPNELLLMLQSPGERFITFYPVKTCIRGKCKGMVRSRGGWVQWVPQRCLSLPILMQF